MSIIITLVIVEYGGRFIFNRYPSGYKPERLILAQPAYGWLHRPHAKDYWYRYSDGTKQIVAINSEGFSDEEFPVKKDPQVRRIAIIGDSVMLGWEVPKGDRFLEVLRRSFRHKKKKIEFLNFSIRGYGPDQSLLILKDKVVPYSPDVIVYSFCVNDLEDIEQHQNKPFFVLEGNRLLLKNSPVVKYREEWGVFHFRYPLQYLIHHSWVYEFLYERIWILREIQRRLEDAVILIFPYKSIGTMNPEIKWGLFRTILKEMAQTASRNGAAFVVLGNPSNDSVRKQHSPDLERLEQLKKLTRELNIPYIDVYGEIQGRKDISPGDLFRPIDPWHYNVTGNKVLASILEDYWVRSEHDLDLMPRPSKNDSTTERAP